MKEDKEEIKEQSKPKRKKKISLGTKLILVVILITVIFTGFLVYIFNSTLNSKFADKEVFYDLLDLDKSILSIYKNTFNFKAFTKSKKLNYKDNLDIEYNSYTSDKIKYVSDIYRLNINNSDYKTIYIYEESQYASRIIVLICCENQNIAEDLFNYIRDELKSAKF